MYSIAFRLFVLPLLVIIVAFGGYTMYWVYLSNSLIDGIHAWAAAKRADGYRVRFSPIRRGGYPLAVRATFREPRVGRAGKPVTWAWSGPTTTVETRPWSFGTLVIYAPGAHELSLIRGGAQWTVAGTAESLRAEVGVGESDIPERVALEAREVAMRESRAGSPVAAEYAYIALERFASESASRLEPSLALELRGERVVLPQQAYAPLGPTIKALDADLQVIGRVSGKTIDEALGQWAEAGGTLEVGRLDVNWGSLSWLSSGTLALDKELAPMGAMTVQAVGLFETLDDLADARVIGRRISSVAQVILGALARRTPSGRSRINIALSLQDGGVYANGIRFSDVPRIPWEKVPSGLLGLDDAAADRPRPLEQGL